METPNFDHNGHLLCPSCGFDHLHHKKVDVSFKIGSNIKSNSIIDVNGLSNNFEIQDNCPDDYIDITFWCEKCGKESKLSIMQTKGRSSFYLSVNQ